MEFNMLKKSQTFLILLIILSFRENIEATVNEITHQFEKLNYGEDGQNQEVDEIETENGWIYKAKNLGLNSVKNVANYVKERWMDAQNKIDINIRANIGDKMEKDMKKFGEIMKKILEIDVNVKFNSMKNGKNDGILIQLNLYNRRTGTVENTQIKISLLFDKDGKMEMNSVELGKQLILHICGGKDCIQFDDLPEFGVNPCNTKPPPELDEMHRSLRPMLLKLGSKLNKGRLWTDNPIPGYKNGFYVAFDWEVESNLPAINSNWLSVLKAQLDRFERNAPIRFLKLLQNDKIKSLKFKNRLHFLIYKGRSLAKNDGLKRNSERNSVYLNAEELLYGSYLIQEILLKALGSSAGEGLRIEFDRRDKYMPKLRRAFAQLNAAYGAENYSIQGQPSTLIEYSWQRYNPYIYDEPEVEFWMEPEYANFDTRKYEIPVVYDDDFKELANQNKKLFDEVYANFAKNSVIQFVVHEKAPTDRNYVRIHRSKKDYKASAFIGRTIKRDPSYQGEEVEFGKNMMTKRSLYHELMHVAGLNHEHQRADVEQFLEVDYEKGQNSFLFNEINNMPKLTYLPLNKYNPRSIMHYNMNWEFIPKSKKAWQQKKLPLPNEPDQMDWENLNHFYGVGKGRTQFKVEIDENGLQKIFDDIDGMRRLKK